MNNYPSYSESVFLLTTHDAEGEMDVHSIRGVFSDEYALTEYLQDWSATKLEPSSITSSGRMTLSDGSYFSWQRHTVDAQLQEV